MKKRVWSALRVTLIVVFGAALIFFSARENNKNASNQSKRFADERLASQSKKKESVWRHFESSEEGYTDEYITGTATYGGCVLDLNPNTGELRVQFVTHQGDENSMQNLLQRLHVRKSQPADDVYETWREGHKVGVGAPTDDPAFGAIQKTCLPLVQDLGFQAKLEVEAIFQGQYGIGKSP